LWITRADLAQVLAQVAQGQADITQAQSNLTVSEAQSYLLRIKAGWFLVCAKISSKLAGIAGSCLMATRLGMITRADLAQVLAQVAQGQADITQAQSNLTVSEVKAGWFLVCAKISSKLAGIAGSCLMATRLSGVTPV
jgi:multidrug efflux pump subunit AcrA (membrane-fusion protein)